MKTEIEYEQMIVPALRVLDETPRQDHIQENASDLVKFADFPHQSL